MLPYSYLSSMERVLNLPELLSAIGFHLPQEDLYACTLVNRQWHSILISILWHTTDDKIGFWAYILRYHDRDIGNRGFSRYEFKCIFHMYGHYIRHLSAEWAAAIIAANESGVCTNLLSFQTHNVDKKMTDKQLRTNAQGPPPSLAIDTFHHPFGHSITPLPRPRFPIRP
ncbi:MAG: hypothetical protein JOS17DRAFT_382428 [Linnemannia elongata]|nr:MAG: hypothetical protein JOS17DRAFT_382428 [Linnemannia elongata]